MGYLHSRPSLDDKPEPTKYLAHGFHDAGIVSRIDIMLGDKRIANMVLRKASKATFDNAWKFAQKCVAALNERAK